MPPPDAQPLLLSALLTITSFFQSSAHGIIKVWQKHSNDTTHTASLHTALALLITSPLPPVLQSLTVRPFTEVMDLCRSCTIYHCIWMYSPIFLLWMSALNNGNGYPLCSHNYDIIYRLQLREQPCLPHWLLSCNHGFLIKINMLWKQSIFHIIYRCLVHGRCVFSDLILHFQIGLTRQILHYTGLSQYMRCWCSALCQMSTNEKQSKNKTGFEKNISSMKREDTHLDLCCLYVSFNVPWENLVGKERGILSKFWHYKMKML